MRDLPHADGALRFSGGRRPRRGVCESRADGAAACARGGRRVVHRLSSDCGRNLGEHASFDGGFAIEAHDGDPVVFGPHEVDAGRQSVMRSAAGFTPSAGTHIQRAELCATCHTLFTTALDDAGGRDRDAAGAGAVSRVAAQRLSRHGELSELPHARGRWRNADCLRARAAAVARLAAHLSRRERFHARHSEQAPRRARRGRAAAGARRERRGDEALPGLAGRVADDCCCRTLGLAPGHRAGALEHDGAQDADGATHRAAPGCMWL